MKRWLTFLLVMAVAAGCARGGEQTDPPPPRPPAGPTAPAQPDPTGPTGPGDPADPPPADLAPQEGVAVTRVTVYRSSPGLGVVEGLTEFEQPPGREEVLVGSGEVMLTWHLKRADTERLKERVRSSGYAPDMLNAASGVLQAHFPAGGPDRWEVWLDGVDGSRLVLERRPEPTVQVGYRHDGGELVMLEGTELALPPGKLSLEFRFDQPIAKKSFDIWRSQLYESNQGLDLGGTDFRWVKPDHLIWELERVPSKLELTMSRLQAVTTLLPVIPRAVVVRNTEDAAYLERLNLVTGERERLMQIIPEVLEAKLSPDKRWIGLRAYERREDGTAEWWPTGTAALNLERRELVPLAMDGVALHWAGSTLLNQESVGRVEEPGLWAWEPAAGGEPVLRKMEVGRFASVSPDGRWIAFLEKKPGEQHADMETPLLLSLVLLDLQSGERTVVEEFLHEWWIPKDGDFSLWMVWSPDSKRVAGFDLTDRWGKPDLVVYDLERGERQVLIEEVDIRHWGARLSWSPDGRHLLTQGGQVVPLDGGPLLTLNETGGRLALWDEEGERVLAMAQEWKGLSVYTLRTGERQELGDGWPVGWDGDSVYLIRWAGSDRRHIRMGY